jgi:ABC-2 type transport system permease protein
VLSLIPPLSPMTMFTRVALGSPPLWEVVLSVALLLATIALVLVLSAKVYRAALLMYGTKPGLIGTLRLMRSP